jgi:hypothetical protein
VSYLGMDLTDEMERVGRLVVPDVRRRARLVVERAERRRTFELRLPRLVHLGPAVAVMAAVMLVAGPLSLRLAVQNRGDAGQAARQLIQPFARHSEPDSQERPVEPGPAPQGVDQLLAPSGTLSRPAPGPGNTAPAAAPPAAGQPAVPPPGPAPATAPACQAGDVAVSVTTDHPQYASRQVVVATLRITNQSTAPCSVSTPSTCYVDVNIQDAAGGLLYSSQWNSPAGAACLFAGFQPTVLVPGDSRESVLRWDQTACPEGNTTQTCTAGSYVGPGTYTAGGSWTLSPSSALATPANRAKFTII